MLYVVVIVCVFKFLFYVLVVFMMHQLKSMSVLINPNSDYFDIPEKVSKKVFMVGSRMKSSYSAPKHSIDTTLFQPDNSQRLSRMIEEMSDIYEFTLKHEQKQSYILHKSCFMECLKGDDWLDITVLQLWCS